MVFLDGMKGFRASLILLAVLTAPLHGQQTEPEVLPSDLKKLSIEDLMEIDVTSVSRRNERMSRAAAAVTVITNEDIRRSGVTTLAEALRLINSVHVAQADGRTWAITTRGFNLTTANKLLVLIDGRSVYTPLFSGVFWDVQQTFLEDVERIEVIRGPGATLWGANAVNGVINIITRSSRITQGGVAQLGAGEGERVFGGGRHGGKLGERTFYRVYGTYLNRESLAFPNGSDARDPLRIGQSGFRVDGDLSSRDSFTLQGDAYRGISSEAIRTDTQLDGGNLLGRWTRSLGEDSSLELQVYWDRTHRDIPQSFEEHQDILDLDFQHQLPVGDRHLLVWGLGYRHIWDDVENSPGVVWVPEDRNQGLASAFAQDEIQLIEDRLRLTVGTKLEVTESTGLEVQPSVRMAWTPDDRRTLWGAVSRAVRTPTRLDEDLRFVDPNGNIFVFGNPDFEAEELLAYEAGYRVQPGLALVLDLAAFYNVYDDLRSQEAVVPGQRFPIRLDNKLEAEAWGLELRANYEAAPWWRLHGAYTWFDKDLTLDPDSTDPTGGVPEGNDPEHRFLLRSSFDLPRGVQMDAWLRYVDELPDPRVPSYTEMDLRVGWAPRPRLDLSLIGRNLLHDQHPEFGAPTPTRKEVERSLYGRVTWRW
jgi:iron complex outermembrane recepter protein